MAIGTPTAGLPTEETTAGTTHSVPYPLTGVNNGDVALLLEVNGAVSNSVISTPPTGFTQVLQNSGTANTAAPSAGIFRHTCNGTEVGTSITVTTTSVTASFILVVLPGVITGAGGIDATAIGDKTTASSALGLSGGITTDVDGCTVIYVAAANSTTIAATPMTGFTELADRNTGKSGNRSFEVAYRQNVPTGTLTMSGGTWGGSTKDLVLAVAIKPLLTPTGTIAATEDNDTLAAAGTLTIAGTVNTTEGDDTLAATGTETIRGTITATEAADTLAASGTVTGPTVSGTIAATEGNDTLAAAGLERISGTIASTEAPDTLAASGTQRFIGTLAATEGDDTLAAAGRLLITGTIAAAEDDDQLAAAGTVTGGVRPAFVAFHEAPGQVVTFAEAPDVTYTEPDQAITYQEVGT